MARLHPTLWAEFATGEHSESGWSNLTAYRWSTRPLAHAGSYEGGFKEGRVESWEPIERTLSDPSGHYEASRFGFTIRDTDRLARGLQGGFTTEHLVNREASIKLVSEAGGVAGTDPRIIARGKIRDPKPIDNLRFQFLGDDIIGADFMAGSKKVCQRTITRELFPDVHRDLIGHAQPIIYGEVSDAGATDEDGNTAAKGLIPVFWVGTVGEYDRYLVAAHAMKDIHSVFASNLETPAKRVQMSAADLAEDFLIPSYEDVTDSRGVTHRMQFIYCKGERSEAHKNGSITITVNGCGVEDVGDGSGDLIRHAFRVYQHFLHAWVLCNDGKGYYTGNWPALTEWALAGPTVTVLKTETFADAQTFSATRLGDGVGYLCDFALTEQIDVREVAKRFNQSLDCYTGINRHGQVIVAMVDDTADTSSATLFRDRIDIADMPPPVVAHDEIENRVRFVYDFDADKNKFRSDEETIEDTLAQDALGGEVRDSDLLKFYMVRDPTTARDAAARRLLRLKRAPRYQAITVDLSGLEHDLTEFYRVTHYAGLGTNGYENHPFFCLKHKTDINTMEITLTGLDLSRITAVAAGALDDEGAGGFDGILLGDETSAAAPPTGAYELR